MLDQNVVSVMEDKAKHDLEDRKAIFEREIAQIKGEMSARGAFYSGGTVRRMLDAMEAECRIRAHLIWQAFARAFGASAMRLVPFPLTEYRVFLR